MSGPNARAVWFTDRYGSEIENDITIEHLSGLLDTIVSDDGDDEHRSISVSDENEWNLEFYPDRVVFENVGEDGEEFGEIRSPSRDEQLAIAAEFIDGDLDDLRLRAWA